MSRDLISSASAVTESTDVVERVESYGLHVQKILDQVEVGLTAQVETSSHFVERAARYLMDAGGKRFRPLLVAVSAHLGDPSRPAVPDAGVLVELIHLATLYHDDVIDEAVSRRGIPAANLRWDNTVAILTGDYLFARASELSADLGVEVTRIVARTIAKLCEGQIREVQGSHADLPSDIPRLRPTLDHYLRVVGDKTAVLVESSTRMGALMSGCPAEQVEAAAKYGWNVGIAFQLADDILDVTADEEVSGKRPGTDLREGVYTLPVLYELERDPDSELADLVGRNNLSEREINRAIDMLRASPGIEQARAKTAEYAEVAIGQLASFDDLPATRALHDLARFTAIRAS